MAEIEIRLPKMGESVTEATITNWLKKVGDAVAMDEPLVEVATDKVDNELPSEAAGILVRQLFQKDEVAKVGEVIAILSTDGDASPTQETTQEAVPAPTNVQVQPESEASIPIDEPQSVSEKIASGSNGRFFDPCLVAW